ncbi:uncharacterized protein CTRU02_208647 [Colletotrichum truncatum]|uniref:Uncharacterized protein n=1 Tax=Colletotrichum truncatum TaxID=5467 RepID=A0ACC3YX42_COLTU|nr:uncharacterized protein CTRU02_15046 [Colletotrichum truncatum]KAF6781541.1 hypothetical protein CTRU02_15046 [Colletotrichum truncatum]
MKISEQAVFALAALGQVVSATIKVEVRFSDKMVNVGNLDLFATTWQKIYAATGNQYSIVTDNTYPTNDDKCTSHYTDHTLNAQVIVNGQWGKVPGLGPHDSREALVQSIWKSLQLGSDKTAWDVYTNCYGLTWQEGIPYWKTPACGAVAATVSKQCQCPIASAQCQYYSKGHKVPSIIKANLYRDGVLLADSLTIEFSSAVVEQSGGCGIVGMIASGLAGFVPGVGSIFSKGITLLCDK